MKGYDPEGRVGPKKHLPDTITIMEPPVDKFISEPTSEQRGPPPPTAIPEAAPETAFQETFGEPQQAAY